MHYLVTGGAGFIGSHITRLLVKENHTVSVIDNLSSGKNENISDLIDKINFYEYDVLDYEKLKKIARKMDGIFHKAALVSVSDSFERSDEFYDVNVKGSEKIFKIALDNGIKVVFASSSSVYGNVSKIPISEDFPKNPINPYAKTKIEGEEIAKNYVKKGAHIIGLRYFNVFGKGQSIAYAGVITKFMEKISKKEDPIIFGDGSQVRDFVHVEDVARANLMAMQSDVSNGFFNIGTGESISIKEIAQKMIDISKLKLNLRFEAPLKGDIEMSEADISLARKSLGWEPKITLDDWLRKIIPELL